MYRWFTRIMFVSFVDVDLIVHPHKNVLLKYEASQSDDPPSLFPWDSCELVKTLAPLVPPFCVSLLDPLP